MPELPDILCYVQALSPRIVGQRLDSIRVISPFVVRSFDPPIDAAENARVTAVHRLGKRLVWTLERDGEPDAEPLFLIFHLMVAGRLRWSDDPKGVPPARITLLSMRFDHGVLHLTEASTQKRAGVWLVRGKDALREHDPGGLDVLTCGDDAFLAVLRRHNHTLKRALTDPRLFDGVGNAYSDEILHAAGLSPLQWTTRLSDAEAMRLLAAARAVLGRWIALLAERFRDRFPGPGDITAFRPEFAVHGRFGQPCPTCATKVQRIRYADNETNYCPRCQTQGRVLADRSLSRLLKSDWPKRIEELE